MPKDNTAVVYAIAVGVVSSLFAAVLLEWRSVQWSWILLLFAASLESLLVAVLWSNLRTLRNLGIARWERSLLTGTSTRKWIAKSQQTVCFLGIDGRKWIEDEDLLRRMLVRQTSNGGAARFLLLDPDSPACRAIELIKERNISGVIRRNVQTLLKLRAQHLKVDVRYYSDTPRFRVAIVDGRWIGLALYSYASDSSDDSPQWILDGTRKTPWSFYDAFNGFFERQWEYARRVSV